MEKNRYLKQRILYLFFALLFILAVPFTANAKTSKNLNKVSVSVKAADAWEKGDYIYSRLDISLRNKSSHTLKSWKVVLYVSETTKVTEKARCSTEVNKKAVRIKPSSSVKKVKSGKTVTVTVTLRSKKKLTCKTADISGRFKTNTYTRKQTGLSITNYKVREEIIKSPVKREADPVKAHGALKVKNGRLVDCHGKPFTIKGVSTHGIGWYPQYVNYDSFRSMKEQLGANCIRLAMYTANTKGYCTYASKEWLKGLIDTGVEACTDLGMYAIIDWHILRDNNPKQYQAEAELFFTEMSVKYQNYQNVIYEICNEPNNCSWEDVKSYASAIIKIIRRNDPDAVILVGTPNYCSNLDQPMKSPLKGFGNIMYTYHFYAVRHRDTRRAQLEKALKAGFPVFVSEFCITDVMGGWPVDESEGNKWMKVLNRYGTSRVIWCLTNRNQSSALLKPGVTRTGGFAQEDYTDVAVWYQTQ